ncbi:MAG: hypothetical protein GC204_08605 [Chloroflexi bacterium]|nr:hypothetical protein [Chloroflexota bacterium]
MPNYYSTQTSLSYHIQAEMYENFCIYVAVDFDAVGNDPTSRPHLIAELWCRVAQDHASRADLNHWEEHKTKLRKVALKLRMMGQIDDDQYVEVLNRIANSVRRDAAPVLMIIPASDEYSLSPGDPHRGYEDTEEEYRICDLKPWHTFEAEPVICEAILDFPTS